MKRLLEAEEGPIGGSEVAKLLWNLVDYGFLEKRGRRAEPRPQGGSAGRTVFNIASC